MVTSAVTRVGGQFWGLFFGVVGRGIFRERAPCPFAVFDFRAAEPFAKYLSSMKW